MASFILSLRLAWHVVVRNWVIYSKDFIANVSPTVTDPLLIITSIGLGLSPLIQKMNGLSYAEFLAPGMIASTALFTAFFECSYGFYVRMTYENVFKAMLTTPITVREVVLGEFIWVFIRASTMALGVSIVLLCLGLIPNPWVLLITPLLSGLLSLPCAAMGLLATTFVRNINQFQVVYSFLISPTYFLSGVFFPLEGRPVLETIVHFSPFYHGVRLLQFCVWEVYPWPEIIWHLCILILFTLILGSISLGRIDKKLTV
ncbi:MAG: ABC transporter permease [Verrucomicrobiota bacterium]